MSGHQQMLTPHPEYDMKRRIYERPIYAGQIDAAPLQIQPATQPTQPIISPEMRMRIIQANTRIYPDQAKSVYIPPTPADVTGIQPTNPAIIERLTAYGEVGSRPWYPVPYIPYVGWPNKNLQSGIQV